ncbi:hypothetical protein [Bradyrhizobium prioriisuperbiae]|uniref:hypothetical protein n=1 Tax=Bradyrhizobium prioriisuperbiae TaxID=2854389 RepID=UPI0028E71F39|nr:hypothetical protein [Bradyrhizobium prioritasuperba]
MSLPVLEIQPVSQFTQIASAITNGSVYCQPDGSIPETPSDIVQIENDAKSYELSTLLWNDSGSGYRAADTALWAISPLNTFFAWPNHNNPTGTAFVPIQPISVR